MKKTVDKKTIRGIVKKYDADKSAAVAILQEIQDEYRYLPKEALTLLSLEMGVPLSRLYEIATFYNAFSLTPRGKCMIEVCAGTACHVQGGFNLMTGLERELGITRGETTPDGMFTLEEVRCLGCCSLAAVARIDGNIHPYMAQDEIPGILRNYRKQR
ncbi:MAG: NAD(P)H-dependent oxidoreductase subunit E [Syntrophus sp. (in: bacteria)]|nr:NAD(P)H-dependent oxidoreductase subunit E [Syntrophus sp. (in: bacteria)]